jgi:hypothetical protein
MSPLATFAIIAWATGVALVLALLAAADRVCDWGGETARKDRGEAALGEDSARAAAREASRA